MRERLVDPLDSLSLRAEVTPGSAGAMATAKGGAAFMGAAPVGVASLTALKSTIVLLLLIGEGLPWMALRTSPVSPVVGEEPPPQPPPTST